MAKPPQHYDLDTDTDYLEIEADTEFEAGNISREEYDRRMRRIRDLQEDERERDWDPDI